MKNESRMKKGRQPISVRLGMLIVVTVVTAGPSMVRADGASCDAKAALCGVGHCPLCCPDDYIRKPAPCVSPVSCCCPDTYCPKPCLVLPCPAKCCCPDDYCPKPLPSLCRPMTNPWYKCVPLAPCHWLRPATCTGTID